MVRTAIYKFPNPTESAWREEYGPLFITLPDDLSFSGVELHVRHLNRQRLRDTHTGSKEHFDQTAEPEPAPIHAFGFFVVCRDSRNKLLDFYRFQENDLPLGDAGHGDRFRFHDVESQNEAGKPQKTSDRIYDLPDMIFPRMGKVRFNGNNALKVNLLRRNITHDFEDALDSFNVGFYSARRESPLMGGERNIVGEQFTNGARLLTVRARWAYCRSWHCRRWRHLCISGNHNVV